MKTTIRSTVQLGDLVVAAFDEAARYSADPREISRLATSAVTHLLERLRRTPLAERRPLLERRAS